MVSRRGRLGIVLSVVCLGLAAHFGGVGALCVAWGRLRPKEVTVSPELIELRPTTPGGAYEVALSVTNHSHRSLRLTGMHTSCSCVLTDSLPANVRAGGSFDVHVTIHVPDDGAEFARAAVLYTDSLVVPELPISIHGRAVGTFGAEVATEGVSSTSADGASADILEPTAVLPPPDASNSESTSNDN
jgi:hypothetical protein